MQLVECKKSRYAPGSWLQKKDPPITLDLESFVSDRQATYHVTLLTTEVHRTAYAGDGCTETTVNRRRTSLLAGSQNDSFFAQANQAWIIQSAHLDIGRRDRLVVSVVYAIEEATWKYQQNFRK